MYKTAYAEGVYREKLFGRARCPASHTAAGLPRRAGRARVDARSPGTAPNSRSANSKHASEAEMIDKATYRDAAGPPGRGGECGDQRRSRRTLRLHGVRGVRRDRPAAHAAGVHQPAAAATTAAFERKRAAVRECVGRRPAGAGDALLLQGPGRGGSLSAGEWHMLETGSPVLRGAAVSLDCDITFTAEVGTAYGVLLRGARGGDAARQRSPDPFRPGLPSRRPLCRRTCAPEGHGRTPRWTRPCREPARRYSLGILLLCQVCAMSVWFASSAAVASIKQTMALTSWQESLLTSSVQAGFVAGTVASAVLGLADCSIPVGCSWRRR